MSERKHVFISYSRQDSHIVERIRHTLEREDIPIWFDMLQLVPGTPNWEAGITEAIDAAFALVLVASPDSKASPYVQGEIAFAEANDVPIFPVWVNGDNWSRTVPLHMIRAQHVDARRENFKSAMSALIDQLKQFDFKAVEIETQNLDIELPPAHISVELTSDQTKLINIGENTYVHKIADQIGNLINVQPSSYGNLWVLAQVSYRLEWKNRYPVRWVAIGWEGWKNIVRNNVIAYSSELKPQHTAHMGVTVGSRWQVLANMG